MENEKEKYVVQSYGIKLIKPVGVDEGDWDFAGKVLRDLDYACFRVKNKAATRTYMNVIEKLEYENIHGKGTYDKYFKTRYGKTFSSYNNECAREDKELNKGDLYREYFNLMAREGEKVVKYNMKKILNGNASNITFKRNQPVPITSRMIFITKESGKYYAELTLLSPEKAKELGRKGKNGTRIKFLLSSKGQEKVILDRLTSGEYDLRDSHIHVKKKGNKLTNHLIVAYRHKVRNDKDLIPNKVLGVDLGVSKAAYMAVSESPVSEYINGGEIEQFRNGVEARRNSMRNQLKYHSNNRSGHGRATKLKPLEKLREKVSNFRKLTNHRYAKFIVDIALKNNCSIIQMEELKGISKNDTFLKRWSYFDLQEKIETKAIAVGIEVKKVSPKFTSQRCNKCGYIDKESRKSQEKFECVNCGHKTNADLNAARNLSILNVEKVIKAQCKTQKIKY
ncbi:transposase [Staphylococcus pseudintermedius]|nr:transposase [Staphylococcus pseudintermedius]